MEKIRIVVADDHPLVRCGIRAALARDESMEVVAEAQDGDKALQMVREHNPDLLLLDVSMPGLAYDEVVRQARETQPALKTLILTVHDEDAYVRRLAAVPISGYMLKDEAPESLLQAVRVIQQGATWFSQSVARKMMSSWSDPRGRNEQDPGLSPREREILAEIAHAEDNLAIAHKLNLAEQTVRNYVSTLYHKIGVTTRVGAAVWAREHGVIPLIPA